VSLPNYTDEPGPDDGLGAAIRVGEGQLGPREQSRWGTVLVLFMRILAGVWIMQGLAEWAKILTPNESLLTDTPSAGIIAAIIFFAIADLLAAVGLWLATPWGGALWLFAAISQIFVVVAMPGFYSTLWGIADFVLILIYFALTWRAGQAGELRRRG
jgi:hypothetical protein